MKMFGVVLQYEQQRDELLTLLQEANDLLRSAYEIASRDGKETNWKAFRARLKDALKRQNEILLFHYGKEKQLRFVIKRKNLQPHT